MGKPKVVFIDSKTWSCEEHQRFLEALEKYGPGNTGKEWDFMAAYVATRTSDDVKLHAQRYFTQLQETAKKVSVLKAAHRNSSILHDDDNNKIWTAAEDAIFESALAAFGENNPNRWSQIAALFPNKKSEDIKNRYEKLLYDLSCIESGEAITLSYFQGSPPKTSSYSNGASHARGSLTCIHGGGEGNAKYGSSKSLKSIVLTLMEENLLLQALKDVQLVRNIPATLVSSIGSAIASISSARNAVSKNNTTAMKAMLMNQQNRSLFTPEKAVLAMETVAQSFRGKTKMASIVDIFLSVLGDVSLHVTKSSSSSSSSSSRTNNNNNNHHSIGNAALLTKTTETLGKRKPSAVSSIPLTIHSKSKSKESQQPSNTLLIHMKSQMEAKMIPQITNAWSRITRLEDMNSASDKLGAVTIANSSNETVNDDAAGGVGGTTDGTAVIEQDNNRSPVTQKVKDKEGNDTNENENVSLAVFDTNQTQREKTMTSTNAASIIKVTPSISPKDNSSINSSNTTTTPTHRLTINKNIVSTKPSELLPPQHQINWNGCLENDHRNEGEENGEENQWIIPRDSNLTLHSPPNKVQKLSHPKLNERTKRLSDGHGHDNGQGANEKEDLFDSPSSTSLVVSVSVEGETVTTKNATATSTFSIPLPVRDASAHPSSIAA